MFTGMCLFLCTCCKVGAGVRMEGYIDGIMEGLGSESGRSLGEEVIMT